MGADGIKTGYLDSVNQKYSLAASVVGEEY